MNDSTTLTLCGNIGTDLRTFTTARGVRGLSFRLGVTSYRVTDAGAFQSLDTRWYTVRAFDKLAENLLHSAHKGQAVIVIGRPGVNAWKDEGGEVRSELQVTASHVGHDLKYGTARYWRTPKRDEATPSPEGTPTEGGAPSPIDEGGAPAAQPLGADSGALPPGGSVPGGSVPGGPVPGETVAAPGAQEEPLDEEDLDEEELVGATTGGDRGAFRGAYAPF